MVKTFYFILVVCVRLFISCVRSGLQSRRGIRKVESCPILKSRTCPRRCKSSTPWYVVGWCLLGSCGLIMHEDAWWGVPLLSPSLITLTAKTHAHTHTRTHTPVLQDGLVDFVTSMYDVCEVCPDFAFVFFLTVWYSVRQDCFPPVSVHSWTDYKTTVLGLYIIPEASHHCWLKSFWHD